MWYRVSWPLLVRHNNNRNPRLSERRVLFVLLAVTRACQGHDLTYYACETTPSLEDEGVSAKGTE